MLQISTRSSDLLGGLKHSVIGGDHFYAPSTTPCAAGDPAGPGAVLQRAVVQRAGHSVHPASLLRLLLHLDRSPFASTVCKHVQSTTHPPRNGGLGLCKPRGGSAAGGLGLLSARGKPAPKLQSDGADAVTPAHRSAESFVLYIHSSLSKT